MRLDSHLNELAGQATNTTRLQEGLHCVCLAIRQLTGKNVNSNILKNADLFGEAYRKFCKVNASDTELFEFSKNKKWMYSIIANTNALWKSPWLKKKYVFHRGSPFMNSIYEQFNKLKKAVNVKVGNDKWNPADVWASTISTIPQFDNLVELNKFISENLHKSTLVPISLKKSKGVPKVVWQGPVEKPEPVGYKSIKKPRLIFPTGMIITTTKPKYGINFRSFRISKQMDITGEILKTGSAARHGKVPLSIKQKIIKTHGIPQLSKARISKMTDVQLKNTVIDLWKQCGYNFSSAAINKSWGKRKGNIQDRTGYWQSIIHSLELGAYLNNNKGQANDIVNKFWIGATSTGTMSSEFIKVY